jgi:restriction system protein
MTRRKKPSAFEHLLDRVASLPWWAGVLLAVGAYVLLHSIATQPLPASGVAENAWIPGSRQMWLSLAEIAQYTLPVIFLVITALSIWRRKMGQHPKAAASAKKSGNAVQHLSLEHFEAQLTQAFQLQGYQISDNPAGGAGGRVDMVLRRDRETFLVMYKQWKEPRTDVEPVQQLQRVMTARGAIGGIVVTSGRFSRAATAFASSCNIRLIDGRVLGGMIKKAQSTVARAAVGA